MGLVTNLRSRWTALALIVTAQFMVVLDVAVVNVALPSIKSDLGFSESALQWVISAYAIVFGGTLLLGGRLADLFGRRRMFIAGLALFSITSLLCGLAWSAGSLVAFRALQGLGGALLAPAALSLLMTTFTEGRERNLALGIYAAAAGSGAAVGVLLGGVLSSYLSWPWIFFVNVPVGVAAALLTPMLLAESRPSLGHRHFDVAGAATVTAGLMLFVYALTRATTDGWTAASTLGLLAISVALIGWFAWIEHTSPWPLLPLRLFRLPTLAAANVAMAIIASVVFSEFFLLTLYLQDVLGYSAVETGVAFTGFAFTVTVVSNLAQFPIARFGVRATLTAGLSLSAVSVAYLSRLPVDAHYFWDLFPGFVVGGAGLGLTFVPVTIAGLAGVQRADAGIASGGHARPWIPERAVRAVRAAAARHRRLRPARPAGRTRAGHDHHDPIRTHHRAGGCLMEVTTSSRAQHQSTVDSLLAELDERRRQIYRLQAAGVQRAGMRDLKRDLQAVRDQLRDAVAAGA